MNVVGYHGTSRESALNIVATQEILPSSGLDEWLGKGRYFFVDIDDARWWCDKRRFDEPMVIKGTFEFKNKVLDLVMSRQDQEGFKKFCDKVKNKSGKLPNGKYRRNYMQLAIDEFLKYCARRGVCIDAARALFYENRAFWYSKLDDMEKFPCQIGQVQICIYNPESITGLQICEEE